MDEETKAELLELQARIEESESRIRREQARLAEEVAKIDLRHENMLLREALLKSNENYAAHAKRLDLLMNERIQVMETSNQRLGAIMKNVIEDTQEDARRRIEELGAAISNQAKESDRAIQRATASATALYDRLFQRRYFIDLVVCFVAVISFGIATGLFAWLGALIRAIFTRGAQ